MNENHEANQPDDKPLTRIRNESGKPEVVMSPRGWAKRRGSR